MANGNFEIERALVKFNVDLTLKISITKIVTKMATKMVTKLGKVESELQICRGKLKIVL